MLHGHAITMSKQQTLTDYGFRATVFTDRITHLRSWHQKVLGIHKTQHGDRHTMKHTKVEVYPTLKVEDGFEGLDECKVVKVKTINTKHGDKTVATVEHRQNKKDVRNDVFLNQLSINNLIDAFGEDDESWIDQKIKLVVEKDPQFNKKCIVAHKA